MKSLPALHMPGNTEAERMDNAVRKMFSVSKDDVARREATRKRVRSKRVKKAAP